MAAFLNSVVVKRRWTITLTMLCVLAVFGIGALLFSLPGGGQVDAIGHKVEQAKFVGTAIRLGLIATITVCWSRVVRLVNRHRPQNTAAMLNAKWRVVSWLIVLEILIGQGLASTFTQTVTMRQ